MSLRKQALMNKLPPVAPVRPFKLQGMKRPNSRKDYTPCSWNRYFEKADDVTLENGDIFRVYRSGETGPLVFLLHGGGYSSLTWSLFTEELIGMVECRIAALDFRGHGSTKCTDEEDLSAERLSMDIGEVITAMFLNEIPPQTILIGHSMGGALAVHAAFRKCVPSLIGMAVIDVVEGTALDALHSMQNFLRSRPSVFKSTEHAIEWCLRSGQVRNPQSARVSMPGQIKNIHTDKLAAEELQDSATPTSPRNFKINTSNVASNDCIPEEDESLTSPVNSNQTTPEDAFKALDANLNHYTWRIDLSKSEKYWTGWFSGLSNMFLSCDFPTMLLLAGVDRLDKELTIGQMQGKFQMQILPQCGHAVHEDVPERVAEVVASFLVRHKFAQAKSEFRAFMPAC